MGCSPANIIYLGAQIVPGLANESHFHAGFYVLCTCPHNCLSTFFLVQIRCFRGTHVVLSLALAFSPRSHSSFQWQIIFQNQDLGTRNIPIYFGKTKLSYLFLKHHWKKFHTNSGLMIMNSMNFDICRNLNIKRC